MTTSDGWLRKPIPISANFAALTLLLAFDLLFAASPILVGLQRLGFPIGVASGSDATIASLICLAIGLAPMRRLFRAWRYDLYEMLGLLDRLTPVH